MINPPDSYPAIATLLTHEERGHTLNRRQILSPCGDWVVFDSRNEDSQIGTTRSIERLHLETGRVQQLYLVSDATPYGPGVGAAAYHPSENSVLFIHGLHNCSQRFPYGVARRFGALWDGEITAAEYRLGPGIVDGHLIAPPYVPLGTLSGGTHAHSWSPCGKRVSFTYDDALRPSMPRTVGFMTSDPTLCQMVLESYRAALPGRVDPAESFEGKFASFVLLEPDPNLGIRKAVEECWTGSHAIAFLGHIASKKGDEIVEVFMADLPSDLEITHFLRSSHRVRYGELLPGIEFRRVTFLENRVFPGVQGPRHWLTASPDGRSLYFLLRDSTGVVQLASVEIESGDTQVLTSLNESIEGQISIDPSGELISFVSGGLVHVYNRRLGTTVRWIERGWRAGPEDSIKANPLPYEGSYVGAIHFVGGRQLLVNRYLRGGGGVWLQILMLEI